MMNARPSRRIAVTPGSLSSIPHTAVAVTHEGCNGTLAVTYRAISKGEPLQDAYLVISRSSAVSC